MNDSIPYMTSEECKDMCDYKHLEPDYLFYGSLMVNFLLLISTGVSELMAASKCKANSFTELMCLFFKGKQCREVIEEPNNNLALDNKEDVGLEEI